MANYNTPEVTRNIDGSFDMYLPVCRGNIRPSVFFKVELDGKDDGEWLLDIRECRDEDDIDVDNEDLAYVLLEEALCWSGSDKINELIDEELKSHYAD